MFSNWMKIFILLPIGLALAQPYKKLLTPEALKEPAKAVNVRSSVECCSLCNLDLDRCNGVTLDQGLCRLWQLDLSQFQVPIVPEIQLSVTKVHARRSHLCANAQLAGGHGFVVLRYAVTYKQAAVACRAAGCGLATVRTEREMEAARAAYVGGVWVGLRYTGNATCFHADACQGHLLWTDNSSTFDVVGNPQLNQVRASAGECVLMGFYESHVNVKTKDCQTHKLPLLCKCPCP